MGSKPMEQFDAQIQGHLESLDACREREHSENLDEDGRRYWSHWTLPSATAVLVERQYRGAQMTCVRVYTDLGHSTVEVLAGLTQAALPLVRGGWGVPTVAAVDEHARVHAGRWLMRLGGGEVDGPAVDIVALRADGVRVDLYRGSEMADISAYVGYEFRPLTRAGDPAPWPGVAAQPAEGGDDPTARDEEE